MEINKLTNKFGVHLTMDASNCRVDRLTDMKLVFRILNTLPGQIDMTKICTPHVVEWLDEGSKTPGYTGYVMLAESHISIHTFPDQKYAFIDVFSKKPYDIDKTVDLFKEALGTDTIKINVIERGIDFGKEIEISN